MSHDPNRREFWQTHWQRRRELGMTLKAYAEQEGLTVSVFYGWSKRFKRESSSGSAFTRVMVTPSSTQYRLCFFEAKQTQGKKGRTGKAQQGLAFIQKLYGIEQAIKDKTAQEKRRIRAESAAPLLDKLHAWALRSFDEVPPRSATGKALSYLLQQWPKLIGYLQDGRLSIDNNATERAIRPFVIGRRNWLFSDTPRGAGASANLYSLIETAKANGIEPYLYLRHVFKELPSAKTVEQLEALLPFKLDKTSLA